MSIELGLFLSCLVFLFAAGLCARTLVGKSNMNFKLLFSAALVAILLQLVTAKQLLYVSGGIHLSLVSMCLIISALINIVIVIRSLSHVNTMLMLVSFGFSGFLTILLMFVPNTSLAYIGPEFTVSTATLVHIFLSVSAYCVLVIASLYAIQFRYIDSKLKAKTLSLHSHLPPLSSVEAQHFRLIAIGLVLLTLALVTGFTFLDNMLSNQYAHKTVLSIVAWVIFLTLAIGHKVYGWRGNNSAIATIVAAFILTLAYFGSRFVREILLN